MPKLALTIATEGVSLSGAIRDAEDKAATVGAFNIVRCVVAGSDREGWKVLLVANDQRQWDQSTEGSTDGVY